MARNNVPALIIVSGGMDSVTLLHFYRDRVKLALSFIYGQKHQKEIEYAKYHCDSLGIPWKVVNLSGLETLLSSALLQEGWEIPTGHYTDLTMRQTVVPFRNGIMLSIAAGVAESNGCAAVLIGAHRGDYTVYPDCRPAFLEAMNQATCYGTYSRIRIEAPFVDLTKREIALRGKELGVDFSKTWSCYRGGDKHCGVCGTCVERKEALKGFDPTEYAV